MCTLNYLFCIFINKLIILVIISCYCVLRRQSLSSYVVGNDLSRINILIKPLFKFISISPLFCMVKDSHDHLLIK
ncbi:hypothetical protein KSF78_0000025 [Schistosoma japonicum]|nr:hypothetical protein KSF78_0000025 [Schistosoma japonicum]